MTGIGGRFGRTVRELREAEGWSQEHLAALAELNRTYLGEVERGNAMPSLEPAAKLARAWHVGLGALLERCEQQEAASIA